MREDRGDGVVEDDRGRPAELGALAVAPHQQRDERHHQHHHRGQLVDHEADIRLYRAKQQGRARTVLA